MNSAAAELVRLSPLDLRTDHDELVAFMTSNDFPFHAGAEPMPDDIEQWIARGSYGDDDHAASGSSSRKGAGLTPWFWRIFPTTPRCSISGLPTSGAARASAHRP